MTYRIELPAGENPVLAVIADTKSELGRALRSLGSTDMQFGSFNRRPNGEWMTVSPIPKLHGKA